MGTTKNKERKLIIDIAVCAIWSLFVLVVSGCNWLLLNPLKIAVLTAGFIGFSYVILRSEGKDKNRRLIAVITIAAVAIRTFYVLYTGAQMRQHDMGEFDSDLGNNYHAEYIEYLLENHKLLNEDITLHWQFYHPPLQHIICAVFFGIYRLIVPSLAHNWDALQCLSLFYSLVTLAVLKRFTTLWKMSEKGSLIAYLTFAFHPQLIVFSGALNNDPLSVLFAIAALYLAFIWYNDERKSFLKLMGISVCVGLGMMAKLSAGIIAVPIAFLMIKAFFESEKKLRFVWQYAVFLVVCAPLGLWYQVRSLILWKVPITYVAVPDLELNPGLDISMIPAWKRFIEYGPGVNYNIIIETMNEAVFDGGYYQPHMLLSAIGYIMFSAFALLTVTIVANLIACWIKERNLTNTVMTVLIAAELISYLVFCFKMPYTCTMSFRYIVPTVIAGAYYSGRSKDISPKILSLFTTVATVAFAAVSFIFYCLAWMND